MHSPKGVPASSCGAREPLVLRSCVEVHIHRSRCPRFRDGFSPSSHILAATEEQQQQQADAGSIVAPRRRIGFVPTLGGLHEGHLGLVRHATRMCDEVWVSIFLNPTQFQYTSDYADYPMDLQQDIDLIKKETSASVLFVPTIDELYPHLKNQKVDVGKDANEAPFGQLQVAFKEVDDIPGEGTRRPGFFKGIGQVVIKLFSLVRPTHVFFGRKDFLQTVCIRSLAQCSCLDTRVVLCPTARMPSGLPHASRNDRLDKQQLQLAENASVILEEVEALYNKGERDIGALEAVATAASARVGAPMAYFTFNRQSDGVLISALGAPRTGSSCTQLPTNEEICVTVAIKAAPLCTIVDCFLLSDTHKHGDLLPPLPNTPDGSPGPDVSVLPPYAAPCVLLLRSLSLRLLHAPAIGKEAVQELEALELMDAAVAKRHASDAHSKLWPWRAEEGKQHTTENTKQTEYYLLKDCKEANKETLIGYIAMNRGPSNPNIRIEIQRIFIAPNRRRSGIAEAFFGACMLVEYQQKRQQEIICHVPRLAIKVMESLGFSSASSEDEDLRVLPMSIELPVFVERLLRP